MTARDNASALTYAEAGVDIEAGNALIEAIKPAVKRSFRPEVMGGLGGFGALFDLKKSGYRDPILVSGTDGVGTKLKIASETGRHESIGVDLVAMCVNDLVVQGAEPLFFLDYFACGKLSIEQASTVISGIAEGCELAGCALIGGETAEMPGMYAEGDYDLAGFAVGAVEREDVLPKQDAMEEGDILLGLASSGFHSNGYSLVRRVIERAGSAWDSPTPDGPLAGLLLAPTKLYVKSCLAAIEAGGVKGLAHITGGGLTENLPRVLPAHLAAEIDLASFPLPAAIRWLRDLARTQTEDGIPQAELLRTFNCGIGMVVVAESDRADALTRALEAAGETVHRIGALQARAGDAVVYRNALA